MADTVETLRKFIVTKTKDELPQGELCVFMANAKLGKPYKKTTVSTKTGPGVGVVVPVTKHFGLGVSRRKVTTQVRTETKWKKTPCTYYLLCEKMMVVVGKEVYCFNHEDIKEWTIHNDSLTISTKDLSFLLFMSKGDIRRFKKVGEIIKKFDKEGHQMEELGFVPSKKQNTGGYNNSKIDSSISQSDYAKTIFLWSIGKKTGPVKKRNEYPAYCFNELGIQNGTQYHEQLINDGYFEIAKPETILSTYKMDQLKEILSSNGLETKGKKDDLIKRIAENVPSDQIIEQMDEKIYELSDAGKRFVESHDDYIKLHQNSNWGINYQEYDEIKAKNPSMPFFDACWGIFNARIVKNNGNVHYDRNVYFNMFQLLDAEGKDKLALETLLRVLYIDVNVNGYFAPRIIKDIGDRDKYYDPEYINKLYRGKLPETKCDKNTFKAIVDSIIRGDFNEEFFVKKLKK